MRPVPALSFLFFLLVAAFPAAAQDSKIFSQLDFSKAKIVGTIEEIMVGPLEKKDGVYAINNKIRTGSYNWFMPVFMSDAFLKENASVLKENEGRDMMVFGHFMNVPFAPFTGKKAINSVGVLAATRIIPVENMADKILEADLIPSSENPELMNFTFKIRNPLPDYLITTKILIDVEGFLGFADVGTEDVVQMSHREFTDPLSGAQERTVTMPMALSVLSLNRKMDHLTISIMVYGYRGSGDDTVPVYAFWKKTWDAPGTNP